MSLICIIRGDLLLETFSKLEIEMPAGWWIIRRDGIKTITIIEAHHANRVYHNACANSGRAGKLEYICMFEISINISTFCE